MSEYGRFGLKYVRTDRNGTQYFEDWNCPRCAGYGAADKWAYTGRVCYECGGSGLRRRAKTIKIYTPEHEAELEAKRLARAEKYQAEHADEIAQAEAEKEEREAAWRRHMNENTCRELGCGADGVGYVLLGNTYPVKEEIKAQGGRWVSQTWVCPVEYKGAGISAVKIDLNDYINEYGIIGSGDARDAIYEIAHK